MLSETIRKEIRPRLEKAFQERFRGALLFGSEARNEAGEDSDLDLMVLLEAPVRLGRDLETIVRALYPPSAPGGPPDPRTAGLFGSL